MSSANRPNRKSDDSDILNLNMLGYSLGYIARQLNIHPTTVTQRLKSLGVEPADTRRAFMEDILNGLPSSHIEFLLGRLGPHMPIKTYVKNLISQDYINSRKSP